MTTDTSWAQPGAPAVRVYLANTRQPAEIIAETTIERVTPSGQVVTADARRWKQPGRYDPLMQYPKPARGYAYRGEALLPSDSPTVLGIRVKERVDPDSLATAIEAATQAVSALGLGSLRWNAGREPVATRRAAEALTALADLLTPALPDDHPDKHTTAEVHDQAVTEAVTAALTDVRDRAQRAAQNLKDHAATYADTYVVDGGATVVNATRKRVEGKAQGVDLVVGYIDEDLRQLTNGA